MNGDAGHFEVQFAEWLAARHEEIASSSETDISDETPANRSDLDREKLSEAEDCLHLLEAIRRRRLQAAQDAVQVSNAEPAPNRSGNADRPFRGRT